MSVLLVGGGWRQKRYISTCCSTVRDDWTVIESNLNRMPNAECKLQIRSSDIIIFFFVVSAAEPLPAGLHLLFSTFLPNAQWKNLTGTINLPTAKPFTDSYLYASLIHFRLISRIFTSQNLNRNEGRGREEIWSCVWRDGRMKPAIDWHRFFE